MFTDNALCQVLTDLEYQVPCIDMDVILYERPDLASRRTPMGFPLHEACMRGLQLKVIKSLAAIYPEALSANVSDELIRYRLTPLFLACNRVKPDLETITFLIDADPACLYGTNDRPPLFHFCVGIWSQPLTTWTSLVNYVLSRYPEADKIPDFQGRYAVHHATSTSDLGLFREMMRSLPEESLCDLQWNHVLHLAVLDSHRVPANVKCILEECPNAISLQNCNKELPVHVAIKRQDRNLLLELNPFGLLHATLNGSTVISRLRKELGLCIRVYYPSVGDVVDGDPDDDDDCIRRDEHDWEMPCVSWVFPTNPSFLAEVDRIFETLRIHVIEPLRKGLARQFEQDVGIAAADEVLDEIFRFLIPHYEEARLHTICHVVPVTSQSNEVAH